MSLQSKSTNSFIEFMWSVISAVFTDYSVSFCRSTKQCPQKWPFLSKSVLFRSRKTVLFCFFESWRTVLASLYEACTVDTLAHCSEAIVDWCEVLVDDRLPLIQKCRRHYCHHLCLNKLVCWNKRLTSYVDASGYNCYLHNKLAVTDLTITVTHVRIRWRWSTESNRMGRWIGEVIHMRKEQDKSVSLRFSGVFPLTLCAIQIYLLTYRGHLSQRVGCRGDIRQQTVAIIPRNMTVVAGTLTTNK